MDEGGMKPIQSLLPLTPVVTKTKKTERGEFLKKFGEKIGKPIGYVAMRLTGVPTADFYFIEKQCDNYKGPWAKCFYGMLKTGDKSIVKDS
jgi:hypothetical protein